MESDCLKSSNSKCPAEACRTSEHERCALRSSVKFLFPKPWKPTEDCSKSPGLWNRVKPHFLLYCGYQSQHESSLQSVGKWPESPKTERCMSLITSVSIWDAEEQNFKSAKERTRWIALILATVMQLIRWQCDCASWRPCLKVRLPSRSAIFKEGKEGKRWETEAPRAVLFLWSPRPSSFLVADCHERRMPKNAGLKCEISLSIPWFKLL